VALDPLTWGVLPDGVLDRLLVFSPHFDDAAMGAGHLLLAHPGSTVVTVFAGPPARYPAEVTEWDALGGFQDGDDVVAVRRDEDLAALAVLDAHHHWLDFVDHQYLTPEERPTAVDVAPALAGAIDAARPTAVILPMGLANPHKVLPKGWRCGELNQRTTPVPVTTSREGAAGVTGTPLTDCQMTRPDLVSERCSKSRKPPPCAACRANHSSSFFASPSGMNSRGVRPIISWRR